ncbi:flagellar biosynthesis/type III secretory pathway protein [Opitutaceae bacterium TAV5]|nr:flagellar biosynthesis/type III secretory pathway protein [Opitutaceae bacterium TAV5]
MSTAAATRTFVLRFDRPLAGAAPVPAANGATSSATAATGARPSAADELAAARARGYREGEEAARAAAGRELAALREEMRSVQQGLFARLAGMDEILLAQMRAALPPLAIEVGRRLLAGFEPPEGFVERICREALDQLCPEREGLELVVCPRDAAIVKKLVPEWRNHFPGLKVTRDDTLAPGDCLVRSRFGLTDARASTRLETLRRELVAPSS